VHQLWLQKPGRRRLDSSGAYDKLSAMVAWRLVFGLMWLALGAVYFFGRDRLATRHRVRRGRDNPPTMLAIVGTLYLLLGLVSIVAALSDRPRRATQR